MNLNKLINTSLVAILTSSCFFNGTIVNANNINDKPSLNQELLDAKISNLPLNLSGHSSVVINDMIYILGGTDTQGNTNTDIYVYNTLTNACEKKTSIPTTRTNFSIVVQDDFIYCIGGIQDGNYSNIVEVYDVVSDTWAEVEAMPTANANFYSGIVGKNIYCIGGDNSTNDTIYVYNMEQNVWSEVISAMPTILNGSGCITYGSKIYLLGGRDSSKAYSVVHVYDTINNSWSTAKSMLSEKSNFATAVIGNNIYCLGGVDSSSILNSVEVYNIKDNTWSTKNNMPIELHSFSACFIGDDIYILGGVNNSSQAISDVISLSNDYLSPKVTYPTTSNIDVYIVPQNILSMSLSTNSVSFVDFDGVEDMEMLGALDLKIESTLPYDLKASLESEISNADGTAFMDKSIFSLKESSSNTYQIFTRINDPINLKLDNAPGTNDHRIDMKLNKDIPYKVDVYKTSVKFEAIQK